MYISLANSSTNGFRKWADTHRASDRGDDPGETVPATITEPPRDDREVIEEPPQDS